MADSTVQFVRKEIQEKFKIYELIDDCLNQKVKSKGDKYLPRPNPADKSDLNQKRYDSYLLRAIFYDVTTRTLNGLVGQAYANDPEILVPDLLKPILKDANGKNITLVQSSKEATEYVLSKGRCGLFVDYPKTDAIATREDILLGRIAPAINLYGPGNIINWDVIKVGSQWLLSLVVLKEIIQVRAPDGFALIDQEQYRVLTLDENGNYVQKLYILNKVPQTTPDANVNTPSIPAQNPANDKGTFASLTFVNTGRLGVDVFEVVDSASKPLKEIPFTFIGCVNNDTGVDSAPLYNLAEMNIGHYRNSADYEESVYQVGQPTYVVSGLTADWLNNQLNGIIQVGSRGGLPLPVGAAAEILQVQPNSMAMEAMVHKEQQMVAIGAKLVDANEAAAAQTATAANIENTSETSILATGCKNVSAAYLKALQWCAMLVGAAFTDDTLKFEINTDFAINQMSPQDRTATIADWVAGAITFTEMRAKYRESGIATLNDDDAKKELAADQTVKDKQAADAAKMLADAVPPQAANASPVGKPKKPKNTA